MNFDKYVRCHEHSKIVTSGFIPLSWHKNHTMLDALFNYTHQKFPVKIIDNALKKHYKIELHGIHPSYAKKIFEVKRNASLEEIYFRNNPKSKKYNYIRPSFFCDKKNHKFLIAVTPGADYVLHYAEMLRYILASKNIVIDDFLTVIRYPSIEKNITFWTGLDKSFIKRKDIVIIGYVDELRRRLIDRGFFKKTNIIENKFYKSFRYKTTNNTFVNFLGTKHSFWGNISSKMSRKICSLGAHEIIYVSKIGTLTSPDDLYHQVFVPKKFTTLRHDKVAERTEELSNSFSDVYPKSIASHHASVPTVLEESFSQREVAKSHGIQTIDNEVSQIAHTIKKWNKKNKNVTYGSIHFATDYIHDKNDGFKNKHLNLSTNRTYHAINKKNNALKKITKIVELYLKKR